MRIASRSASPSISTRSRSLEPKQLGERLAEFLKRSHRARSIQIEGLRLLTGGASRQTWSFDATIEDEDGRVRTVLLVLRSNPREGPSSMTGDTEYRLLRAAGEAVPVPGVHLLGDDSLESGGWSIRSSRRRWCLLAGRNERRRGPSIRRRWRDPRGSVHEFRLRGRRLSGVGVRWKIVVDVCGEGVEIDSLPVELPECDLDAELLLESGVRPRQKQRVETELEECRVLVQATRVDPTEVVEDLLESRKDTRSSPLRRVS